LSELEGLFREYGETVAARAATMFTMTPKRCAMVRHQEPSPIGRTCPPAPICSFYEGLHGAATTDTVDIGRYVDLCIGVVPIINLEWIQKLHRDKAQRGYSTEAVMDTILRRMPDYINYICPQFSGRTSIFSGCRRSIPRIPSSPRTFRRRMKACW
jgi:phosphoribulokinase